MLKKRLIKLIWIQKNLLDKNIQAKKDAFEKEIDKDIAKAQKEISDLKNSIMSIQKYLKILLQILLKIYLEHKVK